MFMFKNQETLAVILRELFYFFTVVIFVFFMTELFWPNFILAYFNLNYLILLWLVFGLITLIKK